MKPTSAYRSLLLSLPLASCVIGAPILTDSFSSTTGALPDGWTAVGTGSANDVVTSGSLSVAGLQDSAGGKWTFDNSTNDTYRKLFDSSPVADNTTLYYSFILQVDNLGSLTTSGHSSSLVMLNSSTATGATSGVASMGIRKDSSDATKFNLSFDGEFRGPSSASVGAILPTQFSTGESIFIVIAYQLGTNSATSSTSFWVNPTSSSFGGSSPSVTATDTTVYRSTVQSLLIQSGTSSGSSPGSWSIDEIRVGTSWADVTPSGVPEPSAAAMLAGAACLGFAAWSRRRNA